jgi:hypothetical protein
MAKPQSRGALKSGREGYYHSYHSNLYCRNQTVMNKNANRVLGIGISAGLKGFHNPDIDSMVEGLARHTDLYMKMFGGNTALQTLNPGEDCEIHITVKASVRVQTLAEWWEMEHATAAADLREALTVKAPEEGEAEKPTLAEWYEEHGQHLPLSSRMARRQKFLDMLENATQGGPEAMLSRLFGQTSPDNGECQKA